MIIKNMAASQDMQLNVVGTQMIHMLMSAADFTETTFKIFLKLTSIVEAAALQNVRSGKCAHPT
jgi:hypothetical protein